MHYRYKILALSSTILFSFYYVYDIPAALNKHLQLEKDSYGAQKITLLYSVYALPNMVLPIFFGWSTKIRSVKITMLLCFLVFVGHIVFSVGVFLGMFKVMLAGRFVYGIEGESFTVIQNKIIAQQFRGKELAFSMSLSSSIARCGTVANYLITPFLAAKFGKVLSCVVGSVLTFVGLIVCGVMLSKKEKMENIKERMDEIDLDKAITDGNRGQSNLLVGGEIINTGACNLNSGAYNLNSGSCDLNSGSCDLNSGACDINTGACDLNSGSCNLNSGACNLNSGACNLISGASDINSDISYAENIYAMNREERNQGRLNSPEFRVNQERLNSPEFEDLDSISIENEIRNYEHFKNSEYNNSDNLRIEKVIRNSENITNSEYFANSENITNSDDLRIENDLGADSEYFNNNLITSNDAKINSDAKINNDIKIINNNDAKINSDAKIINNKDSGVCSAQLNARSLGDNLESESEMKLEGNVKSHIKTNSGDILTNDQFNAKNTASKDGIQCLNNESTENLSYRKDFSNELKKINSPCTTKKNLDINLENTKEDCSRFYAKDNYYIRDVHEINLENDRDKIEVMPNQESNTRFTPVFGVLEGLTSKDLSLEHENYGNVWEPENVDVNDRQPFSRGCRGENRFRQEVWQKLSSSNSRSLKDEHDTFLVEPALQGKCAFGSGFSLLIAISFLYAVIWAPFSNIATIMFQKRYGVDTINAGRLMAIEEGMSLFLVVAIGSLSDHIGFKLYFVGLGGILLTLAHFFIFFNYGPPIIPILILGASGPMISCYWPCITYVVSDESIGAGFAVFACVLNVAYTFSPIMVSILISHDPSYDTVEFFILFVSFVAFAFILVLSLINRRYRLGLNNRSINSS